MFLELPKFFRRFFVSISPPVSYHRSALLIIHGNDGALDGVAVAVAVLLHEFAVESPLECHRVKKMPMLEDF